MFVKTYFRLAFPMILSQLVVYLVNNFSVAMMGALSDKAISGYTIANESFSIYSMLVLGLTGGFHVYITQYYGDQNQEKYNQVLRFGMKLCFAMGLVVAAAFFIGAEPFVRIFIDDDEIVSYAIRYLRIFCWTFIPYAINLLWSGVYQMTGRAVITFYSGVINCLTNALLCYLLINRIGIQGAASALLAARLAESLFLFLKMNRKESEFNFRNSYPAIKMHEIRRIFETSWPLVANEALFSVAFMFIMRNYSLVSQYHLACYTVVNNASQLVFVATQGTSAVIGVLVGGMLGAGKIQEAKDNSDRILQLTFILYAIGGIILASLARVIPGLYSLDGDLAEMAVRMLYAKSLLGFGGMTMCFYNTLRIGGDTRSVFLLDGIYSCIFPLGVSCLLTYVLHASFFWLYVCVDFMQIVKCFFGYFLLRRGKWLTKLS